MMTRKDYMDTPYEGQAVAHRLYYGEIAQECGIKVPGYLLDLCKGKLDDPYFNTVPLRLWDHEATSIKDRVRSAMKARGDCVSLGSLVCILKEAARQQLGVK